MRWQLRRCSTRIYINALVSNFDKKGQRFATNPIGRMLRRARTAHLALIEGHLAKKTIMRGRQHANFPRTNPAHISGAYPKRFRR